MIALHARAIWARGLVVMTAVSHTAGREFDPPRAHLSAGMKIYFETYGCTMNQGDTESMDSCGVIEYAERNNRRRLPAENKFSCCRKGRIGEFDRIRIRDATPTYSIA